MFAWSFYSQGAAEDRQTTAEPFIAAALAFFGDPTPERGGKRKKFYRLAPDGVAAVSAAQEQLSRLGRSLSAKLRTLS